MEQITKLTNRVAAFECNNGPKQHSSFMAGKESFDFSPINANNKRIHTNEAYNYESIFRLPVPISGNVSPKSHKVKFSSTQKRVQIKHCSNKFRI